MTKIYAKRVDKNQPAIVKELRDLGYTVELDKDDIIVGKDGKNIWIEIKERCPFQKNGTIEAGFIKDSQYKILCEWNGQYNICWNLDQILNTFSDKFGARGITPVRFRSECYNILSPKELNRLRQEKWWNLG